MPCLYRRRGDESFCGVETPARAGLRTSGKQLLVHVLDEERRQGDGCAFALVCADDPRFAWS
jgi:hypothetical protein